MTAASGEIAARIRDRLDRLRRHMRREAILGEAVARTAVRHDLSPGAAARHLAERAAATGVELLDVAAAVEPVPRPAPVPEAPGWVRSVLEAVHVSAAYLVPVSGAGERVVDFVVAACNEHARDVTGRGPAELTGERLTQVNPGVIRSGLLAAYIRVHEGGPPLWLAQLEYVEVRDRLLWPAALSVRAVALHEGVLASWRVLGEDERLVTRWERALREAELGWAEWTLATGTTYWSGQMYQIFGRDPADGPLPLEELPAAVLAADVPLLDELMATLLDHGVPADAEFRIRRRYGVRQVRTVGEPVLDEEGTPVVIRMMVQDVTSSRRRERALSEAHDQAARQRRRAEEEQRIAHRLQDAILPGRREALDLPGLRLGVRYLPAEDVRRLGGDWFKARPMPDGRVLVAIGDAMGHGLAAVGLMAQLRFGLAGLAYTGADAAQLATWLNDLIYHDTEAVSVTGTAVIGHYEPDSRVLTWTSAGHPPPLLVRDGVAGLLEPPPGLLLGALESAAYELTATRLRAGDLLFLYTDGVVERRGHDLDAGLKRLLQAAGACPADDPQEAISCVLNRIGRNTHDDVCMLALRVL
ncbi:PP2C family protein-serine/threonine phosphatase [Nonomuraea typhae]|uniref:PP2C family protein-serine/threonine phosphatase n=1 Tax=Nonomuraea typhae TaxID=2603600 RepID=UPI0012FC87A9|nr:PP2C family protein-serine/threonine phosphatase [Nonomuraea typhae]